jgi:1,2-dihydroxy-3-keto-5-methylthiopentene dioxygenase
MAVLTIPDENLKVEGEAEIRAHLAALGIGFERWDLSRVPADAPAEAVLEAFAPEIDEMKRLGGYTTADVVDVNSEMPGLETMLARFDKEHTHSEDEVRFVLSGRGIFFLNLDGKVVSIEVHPGDMLRVPQGTTHWFTLCGERRIRAIRWFQDTTGWTPHYTASGAEQGYQPLCFGPAYLGPHAAISITSNAGA